MYSKVNELHVDTVSIAGKNMRLIGEKMLTLDLRGLQFKFEIEKYHPSTYENWTEEWCDVHISITGNVHYERKAETMLCAEVEMLKRQCEKFLTAEWPQQWEITFAEPDYEFRFNANHKKIGDVELKINLWNEGVLTCNYLVVTFGYEDIDKLNQYLSEVTA